jgi:hypothetical protein
MTSRTKTVEKWAWILIYGGLGVAGLGWFMRTEPGPWGEWLIAGGAVGVVAGVALIIWRSRMKEEG